MILYFEKKCPNSHIDGQQCCEAAREVERDAGNVTPGWIFGERGKQLQPFITLPGLPLIKHGKASCSKPSP